MIRRVGGAHNWVQACHVRGSQLEHVERACCLHAKHSALLVQAEKTKELALIRAEEEERLATALVRRVHEKERRDKEVQHLREQSAELRE